MNIISNNYEKVLKEMIFCTFSNNLQKALNKCNHTNQVFNYISLLSNLDDSLCNIAKNSLISIFESVDKSYCNSPERKKKYHIKAHHSRTILTIFGEITFTRTFYSDRFNHGSFCYLDRFLGLKKHDYFDPYIKATIIEYAANNSIPTVCSMVNDLIGNRMKLNNLDIKVKYLNRQTARNVILNSPISSPHFKQLDTPDTLYIMADEKWTHTQRNDHKSVMVKSIVTFDGFSSFNNQFNSSYKRNYLINKRIFAHFKQGFLDNVLDYLYYTYNLDEVKNIVIMGDGASWIKSLTTHFKINSNTNVIFALDKFHFKQAIHHICLDKSLEDILSSYVIGDNQSAFIDCCNLLIEHYPHRQETIDNKKQYILNNWQYILNLYRYNLSCPMESQISHNLAYLLTARPKGYSLTMLDKILNIRMLFKNKENIKLLYFNNFNKKEVVTMNKDTLNFNFKTYISHINYNQLIRDPIYPIPYDRSYPKNLNII